MLHTEYFCVIEVQKIRGPTIGIDILFQQFESNARRIVVSFRAIVDRACVTQRPGSPLANRLAKIMRKGRDTAKAWQVVAQKGNAPREARIAQKNPLKCRVAAAGLEPETSFSFRQ